MIEKKNKELGSTSSGFFFFQAEDGIRDHCVTGVQTCALPIYGILGTVGTLGGANSYGIAVNDNGTVVGEAERADNATHAFVSKNGVMTDLGTQIGRASCRERV